MIMLLLGSLIYLLLPMAEIECKKPFYLCMVNKINFLFLLLNLIFMNFIYYLFDFWVVHQNHLEKYLKFSWIAMLLPFMGIHFTKKT